jgi:hypothetical protein
MTVRITNIIASATAAMSGGGRILAEDANATAFFETHIRPAFAEHCYECHSVEGGKRKGGLLLDSRDGWAVGGDSGAALVPGDPKASLLLDAIRYEDPDLEMPPKKRLAAEVVKRFEEWIAMGAPDPREDSAVASSEESIDLEAGRQFWAFRPMRRESQPKPRDRDRVRTPIDAHVFARHDSEEIHAVGETDPYTFVRRLYFDLIGLPPSTEQIETFVADPSDTAIRTLVEELLASTHFGEKWGRHWLDLARFAESTGGGRSSLLANAWRYRNYVIGSYNDDKPYDQFIREQLAGDLIEPRNDRDRADGLIATAFLALGPKNLDLQDKEALRMNTVDEQLDTVGRAMLGMTIGCARCHDHKFDPIPTADYYALAGIFRSTQTLVLGNVSTLIKQRLPAAAERVAEVEAHGAGQKKLEKKVAAARKDKTDEGKAALKKLQDELAAWKKGAPEPLPVALSVKDHTETDDYNICVRGNVHSLGDPVRRGFLQVTLRAGEPSPTISANQSGRLELADWIASDANPLTARVYVNRVWHHLFGSGIVRSVDNFGMQGSPPSHPELLDYLATRFVDHGWSTKQLVREIVNSTVYRLASADNANAASIDPENRLLWRANSRRLSAEALRDSIRMAGGTLNLRPVQSILPESALTSVALTSMSVDVPKLVEPDVRSVYVPIFREEGRNPLFDVFDFANPSFTVGRRATSTLPTQALFMMNSPFVMTQAEKAAARLLAESGLTTAGRINRAYHRTINRPPTPEESRMIADHLQDRDEREAWTQVFHTLFACVDFRYLN